MEPEPVRARCMHLHADMIGDEAVHISISVEGNWLPSRVRRTVRRCQAEQCFAASVLATDGVGPA